MPSASAVRSICRISSISAMLPANSTRWSRMTVQSSCCGRLSTTRLRKFFNADLRRVERKRYMSAARCMHVLTSRVMCGDAASHEIVSIRASRAVTGCVAQRGRLGVRIPVVTTDHRGLLAGGQCGTSGHGRADFLGRGRQERRGMIEFYARRSDAGQFGDHAVDLPPCEVFRAEQIAFSRSAVFGDEQMADRDVARRHDVAATRIGAAEGIGEIGDDHAVAGTQARTRRTKRHRRARQRTSSFRFSAEPQCASVLRDLRRNIGSLAVAVGQSRGLTDARGIIADSRTPRTTT